MWPVACVCVCAYARRFWGFSAGFSSQVLGEAGKGCVWALPVRASDLRPSDMLNY